MLFSVSPPGLPNPFICTVDCCSKRNKVFKNRSWRRENYLFSPFQNSIKSRITIVNVKYNITLELKEHSPHADDIVRQILKESFRQFKSFQINSGYLKEKYI